MGETDQVALLRLTKSSDEQGSASSSSWQATWRVQECTTQSGPDSPVHPQLTPARAYHATAFVWDRYLFVAGGIKLGKSSPHVTLLDTHTWQWMNTTIVALPANHGMPRERHGCSLIWDAARQRLVLFGGATGRDILRSGEDVCDVWQLAPEQPLAEPLTHESFVKSLPWRWRLLQEDQNRMSGADTDQAGHVEADSNRLSPAESLCLGRCHAAHRVSRDTVMLVFGSSKPSSNGVLGYDLSCDEFRRPRVTGSLPQGRLCFASAFLPNQSAIWVHSGWSTQFDGVIDDTVSTNMALLQLAPSLSLSNPFRLQCLPPTTLIPPPAPVPPVTDEQVLRARRQRFFGHAGMQYVSFGMSYRVV